MNSEKKQNVLFPKIECQERLEELRRLKARVEYTIKQHREEADRMEEKLRENSLRIEELIKKDTQLMQSLEKLLNT